MKIRSPRQYSSERLLHDESHPPFLCRIALLSLFLGLNSFSLNGNAASLTLVTKDAGGNAANATSSNPSISNNGRYVLYHSDAVNLVDGDTNNATDVFLYDRKTGATSRITQGNDDSVDARISNNLGYVVFSSFASNLVDEPGNLFSDIFLYETKTGVIKKISVDTQGTPGNSGSFTPSISSNGRYVVYESNANNLVPGDNNVSLDIFLYDKKKGTTVMVSADNSSGTPVPGNAASNFARISGNGRYVVYQSDATNLVAGDGNGASDIFLFDKKKKITYLISATAGGQGNGNSITPFISNNGRYLVYASAASNLVEGDSNGTTDIFLYDTGTGATRIVSVNSAGQQGNGESLSPRISGNGRYIVYSSAARNLVEGDTNNLPDIFRYDTKTGVTTRVSVKSDGITQGTGGGSFSPGVSNNGRYMAFESFADNLADGDGNGTSDIFLYDNK
jgi:Tol biopolymer transport system component